MPRAPSIVKLQRGSYGKGGEILDWTYYDTIQLAAAVTILRFFAVPVGGVAAKTLDFTNMTTAGQIPQGQHLTVHALKMMMTTGAILGTADVQNVYAMMKVSTLEIRLPGKDSMGTWTLQELFGMSTNIAMTPTVAGDNIPLNQPRYHSIFPLNTPLVLAALTPFEVIVTHHTALPAALNDTYLTVGLNGKLRRAS